MGSRFGVRRSDRRTPPVESKFAEAVSEMCYGDVWVAKALAGLYEQLDSMSPHEQAWVVGARIHFRKYKRLSPKQHARLRKMKNALDLGVYAAYQANKHLTPTVVQLLDAHSWALDGRKHAAADDLVRSFQKNGFLSALQLEFAAQLLADTKWLPPT